jgi:hypothetical protein
MGELINIGGIDSALCDKSLLNLLNSIFFKVNNGIDNLYNNLIQTKKYQEIRSKIIDNQFNYLEELKNEKRYSHPPRSEFFIFDSSLAENILELMSSYHIMLTHEGMCNLMNYFFYDVYCSKKSLPPHYSFAKPTEDDAYEDRKFTIQTIPHQNGIGIKILFLRGLMKMHFTKLMQESSGKILRKNYCKS